MSVVITLEDIQAYSEVDYIINHMNVKYREKVPEKLLNFFAELKDPNHIVKINPYIPLQNQGLKKYTLEIIALLHLKYWCEDEERKKELYDIMLDNQENLEEKLRQKFNVENIFENQPNENNQIQENNSEEDFSRPRVVQRYNQYTEQNSDIEDYTDLVQEENIIKEPESNNLIQEKGLKIFEKLKNTIISIFNKIKK